MLEFVWDIVVFILCLIEPVCFLVVVISLICIGCYTRKIRRDYELVIAKRVECRYSTKTEIVRDPLGDTEYTERTYQFLGPTIETTHKTKAYKEEKVDYCRSKYQYIVDYYPHILVVERSVNRGKKGELPTPPETTEVYYKRSNPNESMERGEFAKLVYAMIALVTVYFLINWVAYGTAHLVIRCILFLVAYFYLIKLLKNEKKRKVSASPKICNWR